MIFSTLFNSGYLDKGLALLQSLRETAGESFRLYVVAFDDNCYEILSQFADDNLIVISLEEFETPTLLRAKQTRTAQEYCWTCSCHTIKYVIERYGESQCTYIDTDMYFYQNPKLLFDEIEKSGCDVSIIEHGFVPCKENERLLRFSGKYCVEFNTFYATENGMNILNWWCERCIECCTSKPDGTFLGDQKYLEDWTERFKRVHVLQNNGAGVAPWNLAKYRYVDKKNKDIWLENKLNGEHFLVVFYHYQMMKYYSKDTVDIGVALYPWRVSCKLRDAIYNDYLQILKKYRRILKEKYDFDMDIELGFSDRVSYISLMVTMLKDAENLKIAMHRVCRLIFRKNNDIMKI